MRAVHLKTVMERSQRESQDDASGHRSISDDEATEVDAVRSLSLNSVTRDPFNLFPLGMLTTPENLEDYEQSRREDLMDELDRVQRQNLIQFIALCLIPCCLLVMIMMSSFGDSDVPCVGVEGAACEYERRVFMNAYSRRCICDAINISSG